MQTKEGVAHSNPRPTRVSPTNSPYEPRPPRTSCVPIRPIDPAPHLPHVCARPVDPSSNTLTNQQAHSHQRPPPKVPPLALSLTCPRQPTSLARTHVRRTLFSLSLCRSHSFTSLRLSLAPTRNWTLSSLSLPRSFASPRALTKSCATNSLSLTLPR
jgi:hypothetical protein